MATIGKKLAEARESKGLTVEDAAHDTRIHSNMIYSIEEDDFSMFASVAYAKGFLKKYSEYLEVDLTTALEEIEDGEISRLSDNELMGEMKKTIQKDRRFQLEKTPKKTRTRVEKPGGAPIFLNVILVALIAALVIFYVLGYRAGSAEEAKAEIRNGLRKALPFQEEEASTVETVSTPEPESVEPKPVSLKKPDTVIVEEEETELVAQPITEIAQASDAPEIEKPKIDLELDDFPASLQPQRSAAAGEDGVALKPRTTEEMEFQTEAVVPAIRSEDLPAVLRTPAQPDPALRPQGTNPSTGNENDDPDLIAVPVANQ